MTVPVTVTLTSRTLEGLLVHEVLEVIACADYDPIVDPPGPRDHRIGYDLPLISVSMAGSFPEDADEGAITTVQIHGDGSGPWFFGFGTLTPLTVSLAADAMQGMRDRFDEFAFRIVGTAGGNEILGFDNGDALIGRAGDDSLAGGAGNDSIWGGRGADRILDAAGDDRLNGGRQDDVVTGGPGRNLLLGRDGDDRLQSGSGVDVARGGRGADEFRFGDGPGKLMIGDFDREGGLDRLLVADAAVAGPSALADLVAGTTLGDADAAGLAALGLAVRLTPTGHTRITHGEMAAVVWFNAPGEIPLDRVFLTDAPPEG